MPVESRQISDIHILCDNRRHATLFTIALRSTITHQHNILWGKIIDIQTELPYIFLAKKQCLIN